MESVLQHAVYDHHHGMGNSDARQTCACTESSHGTAHGMSLMWRLTLLQGLQNGLRIYLHLSRYASQHRDAAVPSSATSAAALRTTSSGASSAPASAAAAAAVKHVSGKTADRVRVRVILKLLAAMTAVVLLTGEKTLDAHAYASDTPVTATTLHSKYTHQSQARTRTPRTSTHVMCCVHACFFVCRGCSHHVHHGHRIQHVDTLSVGIRCI